MAEQTAVGSGGQGLIGRTERMSEIEVRTHVGVVVCGAEAAACRCVLAVGHDGPHECSPDPCDGAWHGTWDGDDFDVVRLPRPVRGW